jgi:hypothetical protein
MQRLSLIALLLEIKGALPFNFRVDRYLSFKIIQGDWFQEQIKLDDPESVVYHIDEIVRINKLKPDIK